MTALRAFVLLGLTTVTLGGCGGGGGGGGTTGAVPPVSGVPISAGTPTPVPGPTATTPPTPGPTASAPPTPVPIPSIPPILPTPTPGPTSTPLTCASLSSISGYYPCDLQSAYRFPSLVAGSGQTIAIVAAFDDPTAESNLATYRATFGLSACTSANGCFRKVNQSGGGAYPAVNNGWAGEISLDVDMASAVCPNCRILLVEANSSSDSDLDAGVTEAVALGATVVSNSYGGDEYPAEAANEDAIFNHPGVAFVASTGDTGYNPNGQYPAASPYVTAVGGTTLVPSPLMRGWAETAWKNAGSFCSRYEPKPAWQSDPGCSTRMAADISADADPNTGVAVYQTTGGSGWMVYGGTSASAPIIAGAYALAGNAATIRDSSYPYTHRSGILDITGGSNGVCTTLYFCTALPGYDGPTGLGVPSGTSALSTGRQVLEARFKRAVSSGPSAQVCGNPPPGYRSCHAMVRLDIGQFTP